MSHRQVSKKRQFVADGVFKSELNELLQKELADLAAGQQKVCSIRVEETALFNMSSAETEVV